MIIWSGICDAATVYGVQTTAFFMCGGAGC